MPYKKKFADLSDEQLAELSKQGNDDANECLLLRYKNFIRSKVRPYFLAGADSEDVMQEGMIGLYNAVRDYDPGKQVPFKTFAEICVTRRLSNAVKAASRKKHEPLNDAMSLNEQISEKYEDMTMEDILLMDEDNVPENMLLKKEEEISLQIKLEKVLSPFEKKVLLLYLEGVSYEGISKELNKDSKSVDNALQRVKMKLKNSRN